MHVVNKEPLSHFFKYCCFLESRSYPYDKWLYQVAMQTKLGNDIKREVDILFDEILKAHITIEKPPFFVKPGHRNQEFEKYRLYHTWLRIKEKVDATSREKKETS
jgi:hypothetical protein